MHTKYIDVVWDIYPEENTLKALTHQQHGNDPRTRVGDGCTLITKCYYNSGFLNNEENKKKLFHQHTIFKTGMVEMLLLSIHFEIMLSK